MTVIQAIISLLYDHDTVIVPALGAFVRHDESAQVNVITNEFLRPTSSLEFDPSQREENPLLMEHLMLHGELSDEDARQQIAVFVADCYAKMREGESVALEGIGTLSFNSFQEPVFEPDPSADFNAEAFGLEDLEAQSVYRVEPIIEPSKAPECEPEPIIESPEPEIENGSPDMDSHHSLWWLWLLLLLLAAGGVALWYFKFRPVKPEPQPPVVTPEPPKIVAPDTLKEIAPDTLNMMPDDTLSSANEVTVTEEVSTTPIEANTSGPSEVVKPNPESKAFIVGGCFSVKENALNMAKEAFGQGCTEAFVMKRGEKFFVCYGQYPSNADAKAALPEIIEKYNQKAWILIK